MNCSIASKSGRFASSSVGIGEGSTLRVTTFILCNFLYKNVLTSVRLFYSHTTYGGRRSWIIFIMKSKNFGVESPLTGVILCWQEHDFEEVAVAGAEDAWRVAAEVMWYGATFIISIIFIRDISTMDINNNNNNYNNH